MVRVPEEQARSKVANKARVWQEFKNGARSDNLILSHWGLKADADSDEPYRFEKFNVHADVFTYTDEEYAEHLTGRTMENLGLY